MLRDIVHAGIVQLAKRQCAYRGFALGVPGESDAGEPATIAYSGYNQFNADSMRCLNSTGG